MRTLSWALLPFSTAVFLAEYLLPTQGLPYCAAALLLLSTIAFLFHGNRRRKVALLCLGAALGFGWYALYAHFTRVPCEALEGETLSCRAVVTDYTRRGDSYDSVEVRLSGAGVPHVRTRLTDYNGRLPDLEPGQQLLVTFKVSEDSGRYASQNIYLRGTLQETPVVRGKSALSFLYFPQRIGRTLTESCDRIFPSFAAPLVKAVLLGDTTDLKEDTQRYSDLRLCGMAHVVAVSGMHMMFLVSLLQLLLGKGKRSSLLCLPLVWLFVLLTGASPSVIRAAVLQTFLLSAPLFERESDSVTGMSAALGLLLIINPRAAASLSLQLSFAAAAGLLLFSTRLSALARQRTKNRILLYISDSFACGFSASVFTLPLSAFYFGTIPVLSFLANLLTIQLIEWVFSLGFLLALLGLLWTGAASVLAWIPAAGIYACRLIWHLLARVPFCCVYTANPLYTIWLVFVYLAFFTTWLLRRAEVKTGTVRFSSVPRDGGRLRGRFLLSSVSRVRRQKNRPPVSQCQPTVSVSPEPCTSHLRISLLLPCAASVILLCGLYIGIGLQSRHQTGLAVLDVGQGQSVALLQENATVLVDCGGNSLTDPGDVAANWLLSHGRSSVDALLLTHLHEDHVNGVTQLLYRLPVKSLVLSTDAAQEEGYLKAIVSAAVENGTEIYYVSESEKLLVGNLACSLYLPLAGDDENERGLVIRCALADTDVLIMGDLGTAGELALIQQGLETADVLVVGHHGSRYSTSALFLSILQPEQGLISVGENSYGHPAEETLDRLSEYGVTVQQTKEDGTIWMRLD